MNFWDCNWKFYIVKQFKLSQTHVSYTYIKCLAQFFICIHPSNHHSTEKYRLFSGPQKAPMCPFPVSTPPKLTVTLTSVATGNFLLLILKYISFKFIAPPARLWLWKNSFGETWWRISKRGYSYFIHQKEKIGKYIPTSLSSEEISLAGYCLWANVWCRLILMWGNSSNDSLALSVFRSLNLPGLGFFL